jgi:hypothetical protein
LDRSGTWRLSCVLRCFVGRLGGEDIPVTNIQTVRTLQYKTVSQQRHSSKKCLQ